MATGTSQSFNFTSGNWQSAGYSGAVDDESGSSSGKIVSGVRQWEFDIIKLAGGSDSYFSTGSGHQFHFVPGTANNNGIWYMGSTQGTRNGRIISLGSNAVFNETSAFVNGDVPSTGGNFNSTNSGAVTQNMDGSLSFQVDAGSSSNDTYSISLDNVDKASIVPNGLAPWYLNYTYAQHTAIGYGLWRLYDQNGVLDDIETQAPSTPPPSPPPVTTTEKRVFCNFW